MDISFARCTIINWADENIHYHSYFFIYYYTREDHENYHWDRDDVTPDDDPVDKKKRSSTGKKLRRFKELRERQKRIEKVMTKKEMRD